MPSCDLTLDPSGPVVLLGGYGTVGRLLAAALRTAHPGLPLLLCGRRPEAARAAAAALGAEVARADLDGPAPLGLRARAVVTAVNDPDDRVLRAALGAGVPLVDVTRWTARLQGAVARVALEGARAPVVLASGWMGGVAPWTAASLLRGLGAPLRVDVAIVYDLADRAGDDAIAYMDRLGLPFEVRLDGAPRAVTPLGDPVAVSGPRGRRHVTVRIDTPEQWTLPLVTGVRTAETRIGFSAEAATCGLRLLAGVGFFRWGGGERLRPLRRALLQARGSGGRAWLRIRAEGMAGAVETTLDDLRGQAQLTALGALRGVERALGLDGAPPPAGLALPETWPGDARPWLARRGVMVSPAPADLPIRTAEARA